MERGWEGESAAGYGGYGGHTNMVMNKKSQEEVLTGTTIMACTYEGGVVLGADSRTSSGSWQNPVERARPCLPPISSTTTAMLTSWLRESRYATDNPIRLI